MCFGGCVPGTRLRTRTEAWRPGARYVYDAFSIITAGAQADKQRLFYSVMSMFCENSSSVKISHLFFK